MAQKGHGAAQPRSGSAIEVGYWVAVVVPPNTAPLRCYVGQVEAVDAHGVRLTLVDWITGSASDFDLFVPWRHLESALIATPEHDLQAFGRRAVHWQERMMPEAAPEHAEA